MKYIVQSRSFHTNSKMVRIDDIEYCNADCVIVNDERLFFLTIPLQI